MQKAHFSVFYTSLVDPFLEKSGILLINRFGPNADSFQAIRL